MPDPDQPISESQDYIQMGPPQLANGMRQMSCGRSEQSYSRQGLGSNAANQAESNSRS